MFYFSKCCFKKKLEKCKKNPGKRCSAVRKEWVKNTLETDLHEPDVGGNLVADRDLDNVAGHNVHSLDLLNALLVGADDLAHFGLVLLESFNGRLGISLLNSIMHIVSYSIQAMFPNPHLW